MPEFGKRYGDELKIIFLGQDANNLYTNYDNLNKEDIYSHIINLNESSTAFEFDEVESKKDNFISWYKKRYKFWEFPIQFISKKYNLNIRYSDFSQKLVDETPDIKYFFSTFGWGNISSILFPHILRKRYSKLSESIQKVDNNIYDEIFKIASDSFSSIDFFEKTCNPDVIVILTGRFNPNIFFKEKEIVKTSFDEKNKISRYDYYGNKHIKVIATYHPSFMSRLGNKGRWYIKDYVDEILNILQH